MKPICCLSAFLVLAARAVATEPDWHDEFNQPSGSGPDAKRWVYDLGDHGWGNAERQNYTDSRENSFVADDPAATDGKVLVIRAVKLKRVGYTSARIKTFGRMAVRYGRVEARMKLPRGQGIWPACWMLGNNLGRVQWPACGEIDIMEMIGHQPGTLYSTLHGPGYSGDRALQGKVNLAGGAALGDAYHVFAIDWTPGKIVASLDDQPFHTWTPTSLPAGAKWVFDDEPFYLILNLAVGGRWPGYPDSTTKFPQELRIDYVRVYSLRPD